ncbi:hypothetical protein B0H21DRAFT_712543 [Amylocystis lapponica]|nr:hypothetical protein B0H21DRAFT_712543 [Amylocystis lapponica]
MDRLERLSTLFPRPDFLQIAIVGHGRATSKIPALRERLNTILQQREQSPALATSIPLLCATFSSFLGQAACALLPALALVQDTPHPNTPVLQDAFKELLAKLVDTQALVWSLAHDDPQAQHNGWRTTRRCELHSESLGAVTATITMRLAKRRAVLDIAEQVDKQRAAPNTARSRARTFYNPTGARDILSEPSGFRFGKRNKTAGIVKSSPRGRRPKSSQ